MPTKTIPPMKKKFLRFALLTTVLSLFATGCEEPPKSKVIAGVSIPTLHTNRLNGTWVGSDGERRVLATRIKNPQEGVVEAGALNASDKEISLGRFDVALRDSPAGLLWSANERAFEENKKEKEEAPGNFYFGRLVITDDHMLIFLPDRSEISDLVERGILKATYEKNDKGEEVGFPVLETLDQEQFDRLATNNVNPLLLFASEPEFVFVRLNKKD